MVRVCALLVCALACGLVYQAVGLSTTAARSSFRGMTNTLQVGGTAKLESGNTGAKLQMDIQNTVLQIEEVGRSSDEMLLMMLRAKKSMFKGIARAGKTDKTAETIEKSRVVEALRDAFEMESAPPGGLSETAIADRNWHAFAAADKWNQGYFLSREQKSLHMVKAANRYLEAKQSDAPSSASAAAALAAAAATSNAKLAKEAALQAVLNVQTEAEVSRLPPDVDDLTRDADYKVSWMIDSKLRRYDLLKNAMSLGEIKAARIYLYSHALPDQSLAAAQKAEAGQALAAAFDSEMTMAPPQSKAAYYSTAIDKVEALMETKRIVLDAAREETATLSDTLMEAQDINECATNNGGCSQICTNSVGWSWEGPSYECSCESGYTLDEDGMTCSAGACLVLPGMLKVPGNGTLELHSPCKPGETVAHGTVCKMVCNGGYMKTGTDAKCQFGTFTMSDVICDGMGCIIDAIPKPVHGKVSPYCASGLVKKDGWQCPITCRSGYTLTGELPTCKTGTIINKHAPKCVAQSCQIAPDSYDIDETTTHRDARCLIGGTMKDGEACKHVCKRGFYPEGEQPSCRNGVIDPGTFECLDGGCTLPFILIDDGKPETRCTQGETIPPGEACQINCKEGFVHNGLFPTCQSDGTMSYAKKGDVRCEAIRSCPEQVPGSSKQSGRPPCRCDVGFTGNLKWNRNDGKYYGICVRSDVDGEVKNAVLAMGQNVKDIIDNYGSEEVQMGHLTGMMRELQAVHDQPPDHDNSDSVPADPEAVVLHPQMTVGWHDAIKDAVLEAQRALEVDVLEVRSPNKECRPPRKNPVDGYWFQNPLGKTQKEIGVIGCEEMYTQPGAGTLACETWGGDFELTGCVKCSEYVFKHGGMCYNCTTALAACLKGDCLTGFGFQDLPSPAVGGDCLDINECKVDNQCAAGPNGTCINNVGSYGCECNPGYTGDGYYCPACWEVIPLNYEGTCDRCSDEYTCEAGTCPTGYEYVIEDRNCFDIDECSRYPYPCDEHATCTNNIGSYTCQCNSGWEGTGWQCTDINECTRNSPCAPQPNATCYNSDGSFACGCNPGWLGDGYECPKCSDLFAISDDGWCQECEAAGCTLGWCPSGFAYIHADRDCKNVDECANTPCSADATCTDTHGSYGCVCNTGFHGDGYTCTDINECADPYNNPCAPQPAATCTNTVGSYTCACNPGYLVTSDGYDCPKCSDLIPFPTAGECLECSTRDTCARASCPTGYTYSQNDCHNHNECAAPLPVNYCADGLKGTTSHLGYDTGEVMCCPASCGTCGGSDCQNAGTGCCPKVISTNGNKCTGPSDTNCVIPTPTQYSNFCVQDRVGDVTSGGQACCPDSCNGCGDLNCEIRPGGASQCCPDTIATYNRKCDGPWDTACLIPTGQPMYSPCSVHATCTDNNGSYTCECITGYQGDGYTCTNINECNEPNEEIGCSPHSTCHDTQGSYYCTCNVGYHGDGWDCPSCASIFVTKAFHTRLPAPSESTPAGMCATCSSETVCNTAVCSTGYVFTDQGAGGTYDCTDTNECQSMSPCHEKATCANTGGSYTCTCDPGYQGNGYVCNNANECGSPSPCHAEATCDDHEGSYTCTCNKINGYTFWYGDGYHCDSCADIAMDYGTCIECEEGSACTKASCPAGTLWSVKECQLCDDFPTLKLTGGGVCDMCTDTTTCTAGTCPAGLTFVGGDCKTCAELLDPSFTYGSCVECTATDCTVAECPDGYHLDSNDCVDMDECTMGVCSDDATCINTPGSHICTCMTGFYGDGYTCTPCSTMDLPNGQGLCQTCNNANECLTGSCDVGYRFSNKACGDVNECLENDPCDANAVCANNDGSYTCTCAGPAYDGAAYGAGSCEMMCVKPSPLGPEYAVSDDGDVPLASFGDLVPRCTVGHAGSPTATCGLADGWSEGAPQYALVGCNTCVDGQYADEEGLAGCKHCPLGTFGDSSSGTPLSSCAACTPGKITGSTGMSACDNCGVGKYLTTPGGSQCVDCGAGTYTDTVGTLTVCSECARGQFSGAAAGSCTPCAAGKYANQKATGQCIDCTAGTYQNEEGMEGCKVCAAGKFSAADAATSCQACSKGTYNPSTKQTTCPQCQPGQFQDLTGQQSCLMCDRGTYNEDTGRSDARSTSCKACSVGYAQFQQGQTACADSQDQCANEEFSVTKGVGMCNCKMGYVGVPVWTHPPTTQDAFSDAHPGWAIDCEECQNGGLNYACAAGHIKTGSQCDPVGNPGVDTQTCAACAHGGSAYVCTTGKYKNGAVCSGTDTADTQTCRLCSEPLPGCAKCSDATACIKCEDGYYLDGAECVACTAVNDCTGGVTCTSDSDSACSNCGVGFFRDAATGGCTMCGNLDSVGVYNCAAGEYKSSAHSTGCPGTNYADEQSCTACQTCAAGQYAPAGCDGTAFSDEQLPCLDCETGTYQDEDGQFECKACALGTYLNAEGYQHVCNPCPTGTFAGVVGSTECKSCNAGTAFNTGSEALTRAHACTVCAAGYYAGAAAANCTACPAGKAAPLPSASACDSCPAGTFSTGPQADGAPGSLVCDLCPTGQYQDLVDQGTCNACPAGTYGDVEGEISSTCTGACAAGTYSDAGSDACDPCSAGTYGTIAGATSEADGCPGVCAAGQFSTFGQDSCTQCTTGKYQDAAESASCKDCGPGKYAGTAGSATCANCAAGQWTDSLAASTCKLCPRGHYGDITGETTQAGACKACGLSEYQDLEGMTNCKSGSNCAGTGGGATGAPACVPCAAGTYYEASTSTCDACSATQYSDQEGLTACKDCPYGTFMDNGTSGCANCPAGTFSNSNTGAVSECQACSNTGYQDETGQTSCKTSGAEAGVTCTVSELLPPINGALDSACADGATLNGGDSCTLTCDAGFVLSGVQPSCGSTGTFSVGSIQCDAE